MNIIDKALVMAYLNTRDEYSFRLLYKRHASAMWNMACKLCPGDLLAAEEITQNAWMRAVMNLEKFEWRSSLRTWLIGIVINSAREENRTKTLKTSLQPEIVEGLKTEEKQINDTMPLIEKLPEGYRTILLLHDLEGYNMKRSPPCWISQSAPVKVNCTRRGRLLDCYIIPTTYNIMDSPLNTSEKKMLLSNAQSDKVPHYLISKITAKMKNENLIQSPVPLIPKSVPGILGLLILTLGLLAAGYAVGKSGTSSQQIQKSETASQDLMASTKGKAQFVLFVHNDDIPPADPMQQVEEYGAWLTKIKADRIAGGEHLHDQGWVLNRRQRNRGHCSG